MDLLGHMSVANDRHSAKLYAYNPSVTVLPPQYAATLGAAYAVSFRVGNHQNCYRAFTPKPLRYVGPYFGFRLMTSQLQLLPDTECMLDFSRSEGWVTKKGGHHDCRLQANASRLFLGCGPSMSIVHLSRRLAPRACHRTACYDCHWPLVCPSKNASSDGPFGARHVVLHGLELGMMTPFVTLADSKAR